MKITKATGLLYAAFIGVAVVAPIAGAQNTVSGYANDEKVAIGQYSVEPGNVKIAHNRETFFEQWRSQKSAGLRLVDVERYVENDEVIYIGRWTEGADDDFLWDATTWSDFETKVRELAVRSLRLIDVEIYVEDTETHYLGVWRSGHDNFALWTCPTWEAFTDRWQELSMSGLQLIDIEVHSDQDSVEYFGLFRAGLDETDLAEDEDWNDISK